MVLELQEERKGSVKETDTKQEADTINIEEEATLTTSTEVEEADFTSAITMMMKGKMIKMKKMTTNDGS